MGRGRWSLDPFRGIVYTDPWIMQERVVMFKQSIFSAGSTSAVCSAHGVICGANHHASRRPSFCAGGRRRQPASPGPRGCDGLLLRGQGWGNSCGHWEKLVQDLGEEASGPSCGERWRPAWGQETGGERLFRRSWPSGVMKDPLGKTPHILGPMASGSVEISWTISMVQNVDVNI